MAYNDRYSNNDRNNRGNGPSIRDLATTIMVQQSNIDYNNPPSVPNLTIPPELDQAYLFICASVANELTKSAETTPAHLFLYNIAAVNNFGNAEFDNLVQAVVDAVDSIMASNNGSSNLNDVICGVTREIIDGVASGTASANRDLAQFLQDNDWRLLDEAGRVYAELKRNIQPQRNSYPANSRQSYNSSSNRPSRVGAQSSRQTSTQQEQRPNRGSGGMSVNEAARRRSEPVVNRAPVERAAPVVQVQAPAVQVPMHWRSTKAQPYHPAVNAVTHVEVLKATPEGIISTTQDRDNIMEDYNSHTTHLGARAVYPNQAERNLMVDAVLRDVEAAALTESIALSADNLPALYADSGAFDSHLLLDYAINWTPEKRQIGAMSHGGVTYKAILPSSQGNEVETYSWLGSSRTFEQLGQRVQLLLAFGGQKYYLCGEQARALDAALTKEFNRTLDRQLSIRPGDLFIESFANDIVEVIGIFNKNPVYQAALPGLRSIESDFIARNTFILQGAFRDCAVRNIEEIRMPKPALSDEAKSKLTLQGVPTMGVLIALCADELCIDIEVGQTRSLVASEHRQLAVLASTLVDMVNPVTQTGSKITLTTLDGYAFELDRGLLGDHFYLVTRVE